METPIWITGLGFVSSLGHDREEVTTRLREGRTGIVPYRFSEERDIPIALAAPLPGFDTRSALWSRWSWPAPFVPPKRLLRSLAPQGLYGYCAMVQAFADAAWDEALTAAPTTGFYTASAGSPQMAYHHLSGMHASPTWAAHPSAIVSSIPGTINFTLGAHFGMRGANVGFVSACASSAHAIGYAFDDLRRGRIDAAIVLGAEDFSVETIVPFAGMRALSAQTDPRMISPFDQARDGFVGTGGAVALCLERADSAQSRGVEGYAQLLGWGHSADGGSVAHPDASGQGLARAMEQALRDAGLRSADLGYINAHATATPAGDLAEVRAIAAVCAEHLERTAVSSTKHLTGHGLSMSGALEAAFSALMLRNGFIAGNDHLTEVDSEAASLRLPRSAEAWNPCAMLSNSSGFGGSNVSLALGPVRAQ